MTNLTLWGYGLQSPLNKYIFTIICQLIANEIWIYLVIVSQYFYQLMIMYHSHEHQSRIRPVCRPVSYPFRSLQEFSLVFDVLLVCTRLHWICISGVFHFVYMVKLIRFGFLNFSIDSNCSSPLNNILCTCLFKS